MKTLRYIFTVLAASALFGSCIKDPVPVDGGGQDVLISFQTGTRSGEGTNTGDVKDRYINSLRVLGYRVSDGKLAFNEQVYAYDPGETEIESYMGNINVKTGRFTIVFIANEHSESGMKGLLDGITVGANSTLSYLEDNVTFSRTAFNANKDIPMVTVKKNITISGNERLIENNVEINGTWYISMERLGVRLDMNLTLAAGQDADTPEVLTVSNVPAKVYLFPRSNHDTGTASVTYPAEVNGDILSWERIILPENTFKDKDSKTKGVGLKLTVNGEPCSAVIGVDTDDDDYTLPRNTFLDITATANPASRILNCTAIVEDWDDDAEQKVIFDGQYYLRVDEDAVLFRYNESDPKEIPAGTNYNVVTDGFPAGLRVEKEAGASWLHVSHSEDGVDNYTVEIKVNSNNPGTAFRTAKVYVKAGNMTKEIKVTQGVEVPGKGMQVHSTRSYVGAFWRASQIGERLIRVLANSSGEWTAWVYDYGEDFEEGEIVFDTGMSRDPNIGWRTGSPDESMVADMNAPTNDAKYQVEGNKTFVSGTVAGGGHIFFRVGLKSKWTAENGKTANKPARYAVIVLSHNNNTRHQKIWLRQGEGADYLMREGEESDVVIDGRELPVRFSPYNLTAPEFKNGSDAESVVADIQGFPAENYFTDYPTQTGAYYQFSPNYGVYAFHPSNPNDGSTPENWQAYPDNTGKYWDELKNTMETCPAGYRRPSDGFTDTDVYYLTIDATMSEIGQSLFLNPQIFGADNSNVDNSVWGYYADGFFDRRATTNQPNSSSIRWNTAVATDTHEVAYIGRLFYNPNSSNASIFFPAPGIRHDIGNLYACGDFGSYWTSSAGGSSGVEMVIEQDRTYRRPMTRRYTQNIRCVKDNPTSSSR